MDVPATLWECWAQGYRWTYRRYCGNTGAKVLIHERVPPARATNPKTGGRSTQVPAGTPNTGLCVRYLPQLFFNLAGALVFSFLWDFFVWEVVVRLGFGWFGLWLYGDGDRACLNR